MSPYNYYPPFPSNPIGNQPLPIPTTPTQQQNPPPVLFAWVCGEAGAKAFSVPYGTTCFLMDTEGQHFWWKTADQSGKPNPPRAFDYTEHVEPEPAPQIDGANFVSREEFDNKIATFDNKLSKIVAILAKMNGQEVQSNEQSTV